jgi:hypothetical protein
LSNARSSAVRRGKAIGSDDVSGTRFVLSIILFYVERFKLRLWQSVDTRLTASTPVSPQTISSGGSVSTEPGIWNGSDLRGDDLPVEQLYKRLWSVLLCLCCAVHIYCRQCVHYVDPSAVALVNDLADFMNAQAFHVWFARHIVFLDQD